MARRCSQVHAKGLVLIVLVGMGGGGVAPAAAQEGFVHDEVQVFGSSNRYMNDRARAVTARRGDAEGEEGLFSRAMAHGGEFQGILLDANSNQIGAAAPSSGQSGGYVQFTGSFPSLGCPTPPCPYYFYSYTFVDSTEFQQEIGAASLAGVAFRARYSPNDQPSSVVVGWFEEDVNTDGGSVSLLQSYNGTRDVLLAGVLPYGDVYQQPPNVQWTWKFTGAGHNEATCVAMGPQCKNVSPNECVWESDLFVVGGVFTDEMEFNPGLFNSHTRDAGTYPSGFVAVMYDTEPSGVGGVLGTLHLSSSSGLVRVNSIAMDRFQNVYIAGAFKAQTTHLDFNPDGSTALGPSSNSQGDSNLFVAMYRMVNNTTFVTLELEWVYTTGSYGTDEAMGVAVADDGTVYAAGYEDPPPSSFSFFHPSFPTRDIWIARFDVEPPANQPYHKQPAWEKRYAGEYDEAALGIAIDPWGRPAITGQFGIRRFSGATSSYNLGFDNQITLTSAGGYDAFIARFNTDGSIQEAYRIGGEYNEEGTALTFDRNGRLYHVGSFGGPNAPGEPLGTGETLYSVDFDPGNSTVSGVSRGQADIFVNRLLPAVADEVTIMLSLVLDSSMTMGSAWPDLVAAYADMIRDQNIVPRDGSVAINVVAVAGDAHMRIPWTTIDHSSYEGFAWAVEHLPWIVTSSATSPINGRHHNLGVVMSADSMQDGPLSACWRVIHLAASQKVGPTFGQADLEAARDYALDPISPMVNQINGMAIPTGQADDVNRNYLLLHAVGSTEPDVGFAAEVDTDWPSTLAYLLDRLWIVLSRETVCPGDYNRDGVVDQQDIDDFISGAANNDQYADWNMDGSVDIPPTVPPYPDDFVAFMASWLAPCPCQ
jgi:hypothetical protein